MKKLVLKIICYLSIACVSYSCKSAYPLVDIGNRDLYNDGLVLKIDDGFFHLFILDIKPTQIHKDTLYRKISSRAFDGKVDEDGSIIAGEFAIYPYANWDAVLNEDGYIVTKQTYSSSVDDTLDLYSYHYSFDNDLLKKVVINTKREGQVISKASLSYLIEYLPNNMIKQIIVKNELDKVLIHRKYLYKNRELTAITTNGSDEVIEKRIYEFDKKGEYISDVNFPVASKFTRKSKLIKESNGSVVKSWEVHDEHNTIVSKGYQRYSADLLLESYDQNIDRGEERRLLFTYNTNGELAIIRDTNKDVKKASTSITNYLYEYDNIRGIIKTTKVYFPDRSNNEILDKSPHVSIVLKKYK